MVKFNKPRKLNQMGSLFHESIGSNMLSENEQLMWIIPHLLRIPWLVRWIRCPELRILARISLWLKTTGLSTQEALGILWLSQSALKTIILGRGIMMWSQMWIHRIFQSWRMRIEIGIPCSQFFKKRVELFQGLWNIRQKEVFKRRLLTRA